MKMLARTLEPDEAWAVRASRVTVKELIEALRLCDPHGDVWINYPGDMGPELAPVLTVETYERNDLSGQEIHISC